MRRLFYLSSIYVAFCATAQSGILSSLFGPSNYNECILKYTTGDEITLAAGLISNACANKFENPKNQNSKPNAAYDDCILENLPGTTQVIAAGLKANACRQEFPSSTKPPSLASSPPSAPTIAQSEPQAPQVDDAQKNKQSKQTRAFDTLRQKVYDQVMNITPNGASTCQYKPVMSDEDYRRCGLNPPKQ